MNTRKLSLFLVYFLVILTVTTGCQLINPIVNPFIHPEDYVQHIKPKNRNRPYNPKKDKKAGRTKMVKVKVR